MSKGVKQGVVISSILVIVYTYEYIVLSKNNGFGFHVGTEHIGALCPSLNALNRMLSICTDFANQFKNVF